MRPPGAPVPAGPGRESLQPSAPPGPRVNPGGPARDPGSFRQDLKTLFRFSRYFRKFLPAALLVLALAYIFADLNATAIGGLQQITSQLPAILSGSGSSPAPGPGMMNRTLSGKLLGRFNLSPAEHWQLLLAILVLLFLIAAAIQLVRDVLRARVNIRLKRALREDVLQALYREPAAERIQRGAGAASEILRSDVDGTASMVVFGVLGLLESTVLFLVFAWSLGTGVKGGWVILAAFVVLSTAAQLFSMLVTRRKEQEAFERFRETQAQAAATTTRFFDVLRDLLYLGGEPAQGRNVVEAWTRAEQRNVAIRVWTGVRSVITETFQHLNLPLIILVVLRTGGDAGAIIGAMALIGQLSVPFAQLVAFPNMVLQYRPNLRALARILALPDPGKPPDAAGRLATTGQPQSIAVRDLVFRYPGATADILKGITLDIPAGARVGIVGGSGCGKSTLARILSGDYRAGSGTVTIGDVDVTGWPLTWKRDVIAFITDAPGFLMDTLRANILFGRECPPQQFDRAVEMSGVKGFLSKNPLDQLLAAEVSLSGGERRKIALARALCGPQGVLILDEPLAQVDPNGMRDMARHIVEATKGRTTIIITHDMDVMDTDFNIFLLDGKVAAVGKHSDLVRLVPAYAELASRTAENRG